MEPWLIWLLVALNILTFLVYGWDKYAAKTDKWRIPEKTLLSLALLGGSLGALLGMYTFRHKTKHKNFTVLVPLFFLIHLAIIAYIIL